MAREETVIQNFSGGELAPNMYGRQDLPIYKTGCRRVKNFIIETPGSARYRPGFEHVHHTRLNQIANLIKFEFNDEQAYVLEFTDGYLRFHKDDAIITESAQSLTGAITNANPAVVTHASHPFADGDEIFIAGATGMTELNGKSFIITNQATNTYELYDVDGATIDSTSFGTHDSATGTSSRVYEIVSPYTEANDLFLIDVGQDADTMFLTHKYYEPRQLTRTGHTAWTLVAFTRQSDPFTTKQPIVSPGVTTAEPPVVSVTSHTFNTGDIVIIEGVVGTVEVNSQAYTITDTGANTFSLQDLDGVDIDGSGWTTWGSGGTQYASLQNKLPAAVGFYEGRIVYGGPDANLAGFYFSRSPNPSSGVTRYDDFTTGSNPDDSVQNAISDAEVNKILWFSATDKALIAGTFGSVVKIKGDGDETAIAPDSISARSIEKVGASNVIPVNKRNALIYMQRANLTTIALEFEALSDSFAPVDRNLVSDHITESGVKQMAWLIGRPDVVYAVRNDGVLIGMTFQGREGINGWHRHTTGTSNEDNFLSIAVVPRTSDHNRLWVVVERVIDGVTRRYVEYMSDPAPIPERSDYFTSKDNKTADDAKFDIAMEEAQKGYNHLDSSLTYDGTATGTAASATLTPSATTGAGIDFTASAAVFAATDVGRELRKKPVEGVGAGRATITAFVSTTVVVCTVDLDFDSTDAMAAGNWYLTAGTFSNLDHLEGRTVGVVTDGGVHPDEVVTNGAITLDYQASKVFVGLKYEGFLQPMSLSFGGTTGPSETKNKHVRAVGARFYQTLGAEMGTDLYKAETIVFSKIPLSVGKPQPLFTGVRKVAYNDTWEKDKIVYIRQINPIPCNVQFLAIYGETDND